MNDTHITTYMRRLAKCLANSEFHTSICGILSGICSGHGWRPFPAWTATSARTRHAAEWSYGWNFKEKCPRKIRRAMNIEYSISKVGV